MSSATANIKEFLQNKDQEANKIYTPATYAISEPDRQKAMFLESLTTKYSLESSTGCIRHCFTNFDSAVVSQRESDCMTNCTAKALETLSFFQLNMSKLHQK
jgi:hypothetical protein